MTISAGTNRGSNVLGAGNNQSIGVVSTGTIAAGSVAIIFVAKKGTTALTGVSDTRGNDWQFLGSYVNVTSGNIMVEAWMSKLTTALTTADTVTATWGVNESDICAALRSWPVTNNLRLSSGITNPITSEVNAANGFGSSTFSGLPSVSRLYLRVAGKAANSTTAITASTNFTSWALAIRSRNNSNASIARAEERINTSTGETSNPTLAVSGNTAGLFLALEEFIPENPFVSDRTKSTVDARQVLQVGDADSGVSGSRAIYDVLQAPFVVQPGCVADALFRLTPVAQGIATTQGVVLDIPTAPFRNLQRPLPDGSVKLRTLADTSDSSQAIAMGVGTPTPSTDQVRSPLYVAQRAYPQILKIGDPAPQGVPTTLQPVVVVGDPVFPRDTARHAYLRKPLLTPDTSVSTADVLRDFVAPAPFRPAVPLSAPARTRIYSETSNGTPLVLLPAGVVASTDQVRSPLYVGRREPSLHRKLNDTTQGQPITLRAVVANPFVPVPALSPVTLLRIVADTSRGTPKTLTADAQQPVENPQVFAPDRVRSVTDTSRGIPKALLADQQSPVGENPQIFAPDRLRPVADTSRGTPKALFADAQQPVGTQVALYASATYRHSVVDTSHGTPATLLVIAQPVGASTTIFASAYQRIVLDTSRGTPKALLVEAEQPIGDQLSIFQSAVYRHTVVDTSRSTAKTLLADAQKPVGVAALDQKPDRVRPVSDTSRGTAKTLIADAQKPIGAAALDQKPDRVRPVADTTHGSDRRQLDSLIPPVVNPQVFAPDRIRPVYDTSRGTPKTLTLDAFAPIGKSDDVELARITRLIADTSASTFYGLLVAQAPFSNAQTPLVNLLRVTVDCSRGTPKVLLVEPLPVGENEQVFAPDRNRPIVDTSHSTAKALLADAQEPTGENAQIFAPDRVRPVVDTSHGTPKTLFADAQQPVGKSLHLVPTQRRDSVADTSQIGTDVLPQPQPIGKANDVATPPYLRLVVDTSASTAYVLRDVPLPPARGSLEVAPPALRLVSETSLPSQLSLLDSAKPIGAATTVEGLDQTPLRLVIDNSTRGTPKTLLFEERPIGSWTLPFFGPVDKAPVYDTSHGARVELPVVVFATDPCYVATASGRIYLATAEGRAWLATAGRSWLATAAGRTWLATAEGREFLATAAGRQFAAVSNC